MRPLRFKGWEYLTFKRMDAKRKIHDYTCDSLSRKISETGGGRHIEYNYDGAGHLSQINDVATARLPATVTTPAGARCMKA
jgi:hypothetical protein